MKLYTKEQILKKFNGVFINLYAHHYQRDKNGDLVTLYELRGISLTSKENYNTPEDEIEINGG